VLLGSIVRSSVLTLEADGLVDEQVTCDRVAGSEHGEANDNAWMDVSLSSIAARLPIMTNLVESTQRGSCEVVEGVARRCGLRMIGCVSFTLASGSRLGASP
jgi:hypothetical protein